MSSLYRFPANSRAEAATLEEQAYYTLGEIHEALTALHKCEGDERFIEELWDTIQAAEGALRKYSNYMVAKGLMQVIAKCESRGDYEEL